MSKTTQASTAIVYDVQTANHAADSVATDYLLLADAKRMGGIANKEWRMSFMVGAVAGILRKPLDAAAELLSKANPDSKEKPRRTAAEQKVYTAAKMRLSRFCKTHSIATANKARGKPGTKAATAALAKADATPKANNAKGADTFIRTQCAMLLAYGEKNKAVMSHAMLDAIAEFSEAIKAIPTQD